MVMDCYIHGGHILGGSPKLVGELKFVRSIVNNIHINGNLLIGYEEIPLLKRCLYTIFQWLRRMASPYSKLTLNM